MAQRVARLWLALLALGLSEDIMPNVVCSYKKMQNKAFSGLTVWMKFPSEAEAKTFCDENEACDGYHLHPATKLWYVHPTPSELVEDEVTRGFVAYKKRAPGSARDRTGAGK
ncbi:unnamed protein product [Effrenium voratum]|nr:unnamed protein product [Effrenium voratum]